jgi:hypothetical protein
MFSCVVDWEPPFRTRRPAKKCALRGGRISAQRLALFLSGTQTAAFRFPEGTPPVRGATTGYGPKKEPSPRRGDRGAAGSRQAQPP